MKRALRPLPIPRLRPSVDIQGLTDLQAWNLLHRRAPFLARAVYHLLESGSSIPDVVQTARSSCSDRGLLPFVACAVHGCAHLRSLDRLALFGSPDEPVH